MSNNTTLKVTCTLIVSVAAAISAILTCQFMYNLGITTGTPILFATIGILLDSTKTLCPAFAAKILNKNIPSAIAVALFGIVLSLISVSASIFALNNGIDAAQQNSREYIAVTKQITNIESEISSLKSLSIEQAKANQITKSSQTLSLISAKNKELATLLNKQSHTTGDNLIAQYGHQISIIVAVSLELVTVLITLVLHFLNTSKYTQLQTDTQSVITSVNTPNAPIRTVHTHTPDFIKNTLTTATPANTIFVAKTDVQTLEEVKAAIQQGAVKPSHRGIRSAFKLSQSQIKSILDQLKNDGVLESWNNNGYRLVVA
ncbi:TPA: hypothetical protein ACX6Q1_003804 [Photobacterium damselae]